MLDSSYSEREYLHMKWSDEILNALKASSLKLNWFKYTPTYEDDVAISSGVIHGFSYERTQELVKKMKSITGLSYFSVDQHEGDGIVTINLPAYEKSYLYAALPDLSRSVGEIQAVAPGFLPVGRPLE